MLVPVAVAAPYTYRRPDGMRVAPGDIVEVPLGTRDVVGVVWDDPPDTEIGHNRLRPIAGRFDAPPLSQEIRAFVDWVARLHADHAAAWCSAWCSARRRRSSRRRRSPGVRLAGPPPERMTPARRAGAGARSPTGMAWSKSGLAAAAGVSTGVVAGLVEAGTLADGVDARRAGRAPPDPDYAPRRRSPPSRRRRPTRSARRSAAGGYSVTLLDGVTGSGKTEVYFEAVAAALAAGRQVLILLPEIALTADFLERFAAPLRRAAGGVAFRGRAAHPRAGLARRRRRHACRSWSARARRCSCPSPSSA